eukprot:m.58375 g.58375  ORF g.58375 m.58375 type:complete len:422 (+) comp15647_c0_seq1:74-1339(+)
MLLLLGSIDQKRHGHGHSALKKGMRHESTTSIHRATIDTPTHIAWNDAYQRQSGNNDEAIALTNIPIVATYGLQTRRIKSDANMVHGMSKIGWGACGNTLLFHRQGRFAVIFSRIQPQNTCLKVRSLSSISSEQQSVIISDCNGVRTIRMNRPQKLNAWTQPMMVSMQQAFTEAASDGSVGAVILTGTGRYYCAGVDLSATLRLMHPAKLHALIESNNRKLFDTFLDFPKPILVAVNGSAVGASVTSATLCDGIIASRTESNAEDENVTLTSFSTPFAALGVPYEGCSSVLFSRILVGGQSTAERMLGHEGWRPTADEAAEIGLIEHVVDADLLMHQAQEIAEGWVFHKKPRQVKSWDMGDVLGELKAVNARESAELADAFLSADFINRQHTFLASKGKAKLARVFWWLGATRPFWSLLMK